GGRAPQITGNLTAVENETIWRPPPDMQMRIREFNWTDCIQTADGLETNLERNVMRAECYSLRAIEAGQSMLCDQAASQLNQYKEGEKELVPKIRNACFYNFAVYNKNYGICNNMVEPRGEVGLISECMAVAKRNITLCEDVDDEVRLIECKAILRKSMFLCNNLTEEGLREGCYDQVRMWGMTV
ncbi:MAG: hypothetical protein JXB14_06750, partial [Candidatus Altiarchaeota archaeon]|nr:hypothetical protein [Candidatus Altiarchaeota archaeon]